MYSLIKDLLNNTCFKIFVLYFTYNKKITDIIDMNLINVYSNFFKIIFYCLYKFYIQLIILNLIKKNCGFMPYI